ncbi:unnamed protein product, partial [Polarella glacialis]
LAAGASIPSTNDAGSAGAASFAVAALSAAVSFAAVRRRHRRRRAGAGAGSGAQQQRQAAVCRAAAGSWPVDSITDPAKVVQPPEDLASWRKQAWVKLQEGGDKPWPAPANDRLLRAARGEKVDRAPKWIMRQAGRYLPEYLEFVSRTDFFTVCKTPAYACEVTLQPIRRYPSLDSMIIFSDILVIPVAMGMPCRMEPKVGPTFDFAINTPEDLEKLNLRPDVHETLSYVFDAIFWTRQQSKNQIPVIGFSGAPWTLMGYMIEGGAVRSFERAKKWLYLYPEASRKLLTALRDIIVEYLVGQYDSGAPLLTVFDTNCGELPPRMYEEFMVQDLKYIASEVKKRRPHALLTIFPKDGEMGAFEDSAFDVVGVSWTQSPAEARRQCPTKTLQGNLDPTLIYADPAQIKERTRQMVKEFGVDKYIANLGHGMLPTHPVEGPAAFMEGVDSISREDAPSPSSASAPAAPMAQGRPEDMVTIHLQDATSVSVPLGKAGVRSLQTALAGFISLFKEKMACEKPAARRWESLDFSYSHGDLVIEAFANPNAFATIFDVKIFLMIKSGGGQVKVSSECGLSALQGDLDTFSNAMAGDFGLGVPAHPPPVASFPPHWNAASAGSYPPPAVSGPGFGPPSNIPSRPMPQPVGLHFSGPPVAQADSLGLPPPQFSGHPGQ